MTTTNKSSQATRYLDYLPSLLQSDKFLSDLLRAFENVLSGVNSDEKDSKELVGLEEYINRIHIYFISYLQKPPGDELKEDVTPKEFIPWLASWVALSLRDDWEEDFQRKFISKIVPLYSKRGTKAGIKELLEIYTGEEVKIYEFEEVPHYFQVKIYLKEQDPNVLRRKQDMAKALLDMEKPAQTFYALKVLFPSQGD